MDYIRIIFGLYLDYIWIRFGLDLFPAHICVRAQTHTQACLDDNNFIYKHQNYPP